MSLHTSEILTAATESIARRHHDYLVPIHNTHSLAKTAADRLKVQGEIEQLLKELGHHEPEWLQAQRQRLLQLGASNDEMTHHVGTFVTAIRDLGNNNNRETNGDDDDEEEATTTPLDYEQLLQQGMQDQQLLTSTDNKNNNSHSTNDMMAKEIRSKLELPPLNDQDQDDEEDQELQVVTGGHTSSTSAALFRLKCPLTGTLLEDPVKNSVCGHAYSKAAIVDHLRRARTKVCPMVGCHNKQVTNDQLVPDLELTQLVRRHKRRSDANKERHDLTQILEDVDNQDDDDDSDLDDNNNNNNENHDGNTMTRRAMMKREKQGRIF